MKRVLLAFFVLCLMVPAVAYAKVVVCDGGECNGTNDPDQITGSPKHDEIYAKAGNDDVDASNPLLCNPPPTSTCTGFVADKDVIHAGSGNDQINVFDHVSSVRPGSTAGGFGNDTVYCGKGDDTVTADKGDEVHGCETVNRS